MPVPTVYIEREPLLAMLLAAVEVYNRECLGFVFGFSPNSRRPHYVITGAVNLAAVVRRKNTAIDQSRRAYARMRRFIGLTKWAYRYIGDFHSHPAHGQCRRELGPSDSDLTSMATSRDPKDLQDRFSIVITVSRSGKNRIPWQLKDGQKRLRGSLGRFDFGVAVFRLRCDGEGRPLRDDEKRLQEEYFRILVARSTLQALNRTSRI